MASRNAYKDRILEAVSDPETFIQIVFSQNRDREIVPWTKVNVRPVSIREQRHLQFSLWDGRQVVHKNHAGQEAADRVREALGWPYGQIHLRQTTGDTHVRISKRGRVSVSHKATAHQKAAPDLRHDRVKPRPLALDSTHEVLVALGLTDADGQVRPGMAGKYHQVNEFLRFVSRAVEDHPMDSPVRVVDCGCGRAYLTFAAYSYLRDVRGLDPRVVGVDVNATILRDMHKLSGELGCDGLTFEASTIAEYAPKTPPDIVLSLHACDTATDEALAQGVRWRSRWILAAPCCQHELHDALDSTVWRPVLRHGILRQRLADILTDGYRAQILRILGYSTQVIEFVSPEDTAKNLMILAKRGLPPGDEQMVREYLALKAYWGVTPVLERMLAPQLYGILPHQTDSDGATG